MMDIFGPPGLFIFIGIITVFLTIFIMWRLTQRASITTEEQGDYQAMQRTSQVVYEFYPETVNSQEIDDLEDDTRC